MCSALIYENHPNFEKILSKFKPFLLIVCFCFTMIYKEKMFTIKIEDGRTVPWKSPYLKYENWFKTRYQVQYTKESEAKCLTILKEYTRLKLFNNFIKQRNWYANFAFPFRLKGTDKIHTKGFHSMYNLFSLVMLGYTNMSCLLEEI